MCDIGHTRYVVHSPHIQLMTKTLFGIVKAVMKTPRPPPDIDICF